MLTSQPLHTRIPFARFLAPTRPTASAHVQPWLATLRSIILKAGRPVPSTRPVPTRRGEAAPSCRFARRS